MLRRDSTFASFIDHSLGVGFGCFARGAGIALHSIILRFVGKGSNTARLILSATFLLPIPLAPVLAQLAVKSFQSAALMILGLALSGFAIF